jgi:hypothetical protein
MKIANHAGVPGTLGCRARTAHDGRIVLLTSWHVLFGNGGREQGGVWLVDEASGAGACPEIGRALYGRVGAVRFRGEDCFVDCAVASWVPGRRPEPAWPVVAGHDVARAGDLVTKTGAGTGTTAGVIVAVDHADTAVVRGRRHPAPRQLLVRPLAGRTAFAAAGDSGAVIFTQERKAVGLIWGANVRGEAVACPIGPALQTMNILLTRGS